MKNLIIGVAIICISLLACNDSATKSTETKTGADSMNVTEQPVVKDTASVKEVLNNYISLKNALVNDNARDAASAAKDVSSSIQKVNGASFTGKDSSTFAELKEDIMEHSEHISSNGDKLEHQREHFDMLSTDIYDLAKTFSPGMALFKDHCPM